MSLCPCCVSILHPLYTPSHSPATRPDVTRGCTYGRLTQPANLTASLRSAPGSMPSGECDLDCRLHRLAAVV